MASINPDYSRQTQAKAAGSVSASSAGAPNAQRNQPRGTIQWSHMIIGKAIGEIDGFPPFRVPPGCSVRLRAMGNTLSNTSIVFYGSSPDQLRSGNGIPLAPLDDIAVPADSLTQLFVSFSAIGDGVTVSVFSGLNAV